MLFLQDTTGRLLARHFIARHKYKVLHVYFISSQLQQYCIRRKLQSKSIFCNQLRMMFYKTISFFYKAQKIHLSECISRKFLSQILLCRSTHDIFGCVEIQGDAMADCPAQNGADIFSLIQFFILVVLDSDLYTDQSIGFMEWFCNQAG